SDTTEFQNRSRVEPGWQEVRPAHEPRAGEDPVAPVAEAVRRRPRTIEGEEKDVQGGHEDGRAPYHPRTREERRVLRGERARHQAVTGEMLSRDPLTNGRRDSRSASTPSCRR